MHHGEDFYDVWFHFVNEDILLEVDASEACCLKFQVGAGMIKFGKGFKPFGLAHQLVHELVGNGVAGMFGKVLVDFGQV